MKHPQLKIFLIATLLILGFSLGKYEGKKIVARQTAEENFLADPEEYKNYFMTSLIYTANADGGISKIELSLISKIYYKYFDPQSFEETLKNTIMALPKTTPNIPNIYKELKDSSSYQKRVLLHHACQIIASVENITKEEEELLNTIGENLGIGIQSYKTSPETTLDSTPTH